MSQDRLKMLRYRAWRRGTRESDLILGPFADAELGALNDSDLDLFEALLEESDAAIFEWVKGSTASERFEGPLLDRLRAHAAGAARRYGGADA